MKLLAPLAFMVAMTLVALAHAGKVAPAPRPAVGTPPWPAPPDPIRMTRMAGLKPELFEHLNYHVHSHIDVFINGKPVKIPAGIGTNVHDPGVHSGTLPDGSTAYGGIRLCQKPCISPFTRTLT